MVLDYRIALDYLFAEQRGVCAIVNTSCFTWINTSGITENQVQEITNKSLGWNRLISLQMHFLIYLIPAGLVPVGLDTEHTSVSVSWYYPLTVITVASLMSCVLLGSYIHVLSHQQYIRWSHCTWKNRNKVNNEMNSKNLPQTWHHDLWVSQKNKNNLTLMVTESSTNTKFLVNLPSMKGWPKGRELLK